MSIRPSLGNFLISFCLRFRLKMALLTGLILVVHAMMVAWTWALEVTMMLPMMLH